LRLSSADKLSLYARAAGNALGLLGRATHPPAIIWVLTQRCFYRCVHCDSWTDRRPIDEAALAAIAERIAAARTRIVALSGGEPFMVKRLPEIATRLKRAGKIVAINTNGHLLARHVDWLVDEGVDRVQVSLDGHDAALHDRIRAEPGSFDRILAGIAALRARRRGALPRISICGVVMKENAAHLADFVDRFAAVADAVELQPLHESPGLLATSGDAAFGPDDRPRVEASVASLAARHPAFDDDFHRHFGRFLFAPETMHDLAVDHCLPMIFSTLTIREDGACRICRYPLGASIHEQNIEEIWNSPARWALYAALARDGCPEPCWIRCHVHPSPRPGRVLRRAVRLATRGAGR
jgi:MoaA/NifB/PqqE/SkfB family radical SAM enzyme